MEFIKKDSIISLSNPGVISEQIISPKNSASEKVTITKVHLIPGASQPRHTHEHSEQIWYAIKGKGKLLLRDDKTQDFSEGDAVRFEKGDIHGLLNDSDEEFIYISVTAPPIDFTDAYNK